MLAIGFWRLTSTKLAMMTRNIPASSLRSSAASMMPAAAVGERARAEGGGQQDGLLGAPEDADPGGGVAGDEEAGEQQGQVLGEDQTGARVAAW